MTVILRKQGRLARITLARPPLNILDLEHLELFGEILGRVQEASVVVIESTVPKAFSAGNDIKDHKPATAGRMLSLFHTVIRSLLDTDAITLADISGECLGGGCEIVAACDLAYATPESHFAQPEIDVGCFPPVATSLLARRIGAARAADMIFTGRRIDAHLAAAWGLISGVHKLGADPVVSILEAKSAPVLKAAKMAFRQAAAETPEGGITRSEQIYMEALLPLGDYSEGLRAFEEKRKPRWADA